jgi:hypothetical protein
VSQTPTLSLPRRAFANGAGAAMSSDATHEAGHYGAPSMIGVER